MSATNSTTHYSLPSFLGSDKPAWLVDWTGAMATIDSAIYEAKQSGDSAGASASAVASDLATLSSTVSTQGSTISTLSDTLTTAVGNINTINSLIGNGTPTTTDQTIIGAINEINAHVGSDVMTTTSTSLTGAINEINGYIHDRKVVRVNTSGATTYGALFNAIYTAMYNGIDNLTEKRGKIVMANGSIYEWHSLSSSDIRAGMNEDRGDLAFSRYIAHIVNNASTFGVWRGLTTGNTVTSLTSESVSESWCDIYITES